MTSVIKGFGTSSTSSNGNTGTEFQCMISPLGSKLDGYDNKLPCAKQTINVPQAFRDAMAVREAVYGEQGVPLEAEFDEDDARSWHWIVYASVATIQPRAARPMRTDAGNTPADDVRRASASASRTPVATMRLIPPPHAPNKYLDSTVKAGKRSNADTSKQHVDSPHPKEPYVKLGRLATLKTYRGMGLASMCINNAFEFAKTNPDTIYRRPTPTIVEKYQLTKQDQEEELAWEGLVMVHAQANLKKMWEKHGFSEELRNDTGAIEIAAEPHWIEEGIEHVGMWKRLDIRKGRSGSYSANPS
jgi:predicted GNAT family N-acyltransferase